MLTVAINRNAPAPARAVLAGRYPFQALTVHRAADVLLRRGFRGCAIVAHRDQRHWAEVR